MKEQIEEAAYNYSEMFMEQKAFIFGANYTLEQTQPVIDELNEKIKIALLVNKTNECMLDFQREQIDELVKALEEIKRYCKDCSTSTEAFCFDVAEETLSKHKKK